MSARIKSVYVLGLGKVGSLVATLLHETGFDVTGADRNELAGFPFSTKKLDLGNPDELAETMKGFDAVVSCLPYPSTSGWLQQPTGWAFTIST